METDFEGLSGKEPTCPASFPPGRLLLLLFNALRDEFPASQRMEGGVECGETTAREKVLPWEQPNVETLAPLGLCHLPSPPAAHGARGSVVPRGSRCAQGACARREVLTLGSPCQAAGLGSCGPTCRARLPSLPGIFAHCAGGLL